MRHLHYIGDLCLFTVPRNRASRDPQDDICWGLSEALWGERRDVMGGLFFTDDLSHDVRGNWRQQDAVSEVACRGVVSGDLGCSEDR